jgi:transcriptional regulator with XRE-family HTH domain
MLLHEAVKKARKDLGLSQDKLSELAGIQRRQLAKLESGGNITLATLRKVLAQLPNLETFTMDAVTATVRHYVPPEEKQKAVDTAMDLLTTALRSLVAVLQDGAAPDESAMKGLQQANEILHRGLGYSPEDAERRRQQMLAEATAPETGLEEEAAAEALAAFLDVAQNEVEADLRAIIALDDDEPEEEEEEDGSDREAR